MNRTDRALDFGRQIPSLTLRAQNMVKTISSRLIHASIAALLILVSSGCQHVPLFHRDPLKKIPSASAEHPVVEVLCLWQAAEGTGLDGLPCRGFAGQILFFANGIATPARVEGDVRIYVFDDQGPLEEQEKPIHEFNFDSGAFQAFLTETNVGGAYQLFVPYTRKGSHRATCSLRVRLTPKTGSPVYSKIASVILPGTVTRKPAEPIGQTGGGAARDEVQLAGYEAPQGAREPVQQAASLGISIASAPSATPSESSPETDRTRLRSRLTELAGNGTQNQSASPPTDRLAPKQDVLRRRENSPSAADQVPSHSAQHPLLED